MKLQLIVPLIVIMAVLQKTFFFINKIHSKNLSKLGLILTLV